MNLHILLILVFKYGKQGLSDHRFVTFVWFVVKFFYRELRVFDVDQGVSLIALSAKGFSISI